SGVTVRLTPEDRSSETISGDPGTFAALLLAGGISNSTTPVALGKSSDGGTSWSRRHSFWISCLAMDPNNSNVYYAGTARYGYVYRSANGGDTWSNISPGGTYLAWEVRDIVAAADGGIFVVTGAGLWHWNGTDWTELPATPAADVTALVIDTDLDVIYAGTGENGVYVSEDAGSTWSELNDNLEELSITKLALSTVKPKTLYAGTEHGGVWGLVLGESTSNHPAYIPLLARGGG
ncbi:MAG: WD40/YVTN/BNR-like repeat-containing protein, partial [Candidatus Promineifilaceae bacterium]